MPQYAYMADLVLAVPGYDPARGVVIQLEGGDVLVRRGESGAGILAHRAGLCDLARWCRAADEQIPDGVHVHFDPGTAPLTESAAPLLIGREDRLGI